MAVTIEGLTLTSLQAQPLIYNAVDTRAGNTSRGWEIQGVVTGSEWVSLLGIFDTWRDAKITEDNPAASKALGTTVSFSGEGYGGQTWTNVPCWFDSPPEGTQVASMVSVAFTLVDAAQAIQSYYKEEENARDEESSIDYGTLTLGGVVITLREYPNVFLTSPTLELTAGGHHYVTGPTATVEGLEVNGEILGSDITALRAWYVTNTTSNPVVGEYFAISPPVFNGFERIVAGSPVLYYEVQLSLAIVV